MCVGAGVTKLGGKKLGGTKLGGAKIAKAPATDWDNQNAAMTVDEPEPEALDAITSDAQGDMMMSCKNLTTSLQRRAWVVQSLCLFAFSPTCDFLLCLQLCSCRFIRKEGRR